MPIKISLIPPIKTTLKTSMISGSGTPAPPPTGGPAHGDVSVLGILGRVGVAARS